MERSSLFVVFFVVVVMLNNMCCAAICSPVIYTAFIFNLSTVVNITNYVPIMLPFYIIVHKIVLLLQLF